MLRPAARRAGRPAWRRALAALPFALLLAGGGAHAAGTVLLKTSWLKSHKNRVTATSDCRVDKSHQSPNAVGDDGQDGDLHMACRCTDIGLPMVAEIVNAAQFDDAVAAAKSAASTKAVTKLTGVWRFWLEHPSSSPQTQGATVHVATTTNPDHSFEIHPITRLGSEDLAGSFTDIEGYKPYAAKKAFTYYEDREFVVSRSSTFTSITGTKAQYNYAGFTFTVAGAPKKVADGWFVLATIDGVVETPRRMVIAAGTPPADLVAKAKKGQRYEALGIPRINLERIDAALAGHPNEDITVTGAYEMIIVGLAKAH
jgi:hypothetical protein